MTFRFARHTNNLARIAKFYTDILGFEVLGEFNDHDNYDGIFIGPKNADWHLEFTKSTEPAKHTSDEDDILVFYPATISEYNNLISHLDEQKIERVIPKNPYWKKNGVMIPDPDGYRVVISPLKAKGS